MTGLKIKVFSFVLCVAAISVFAPFTNADTVVTNVSKSISDIELNVPLIDLSSREVLKQLETTTLEKYIRAIYTFGLGLVSLFAVAIIIFGGIKYTVSAGNPSQIEDAKEWIKAALYGLLLLLGAVLILRTVNPKLINLKGIDVSFPTNNEIVFDSQHEQGQYDNQAIGVLTELNDWDGSKKIVFKGEGFFRGIAEEARLFSKVATDINTTIQNSSFPVEKKQQAATIIQSIEQGGKTIGQLGEEIGAEYNRLLDEYNNNQRESLAIPVLSKNNTPETIRIQKMLTEKSKTIAEKLLNFKTTRDQKREQYKKASEELLALIPDSASTAQVKENYQKVINIK